MYVNGVESAKAYQVPAGSAVVLWDENDPIFYIKKRNASGQETPMKRFRYVEEVDEYGSSEAYVTKEDLNVFKDEIMDLLTKPESNPKNRIISRDGDEYIECACKYKIEDPEAARLMYELSVEELGHSERLHELVISKIEKYKRENGEPPKEMMALYNYIHEKMIEDKTKVVIMQELFKK